ncbi:MULTISPECIES: ABC transporter ATP-binding protein [Bacillota]|jgi:putative ABC transport system ATP-binding protein|uniref:ABC transporter ATP-binding protein n=2 Tax=Amedibacillus TaxID=2749846 RepID=A0A7G9GTP9_9FIRM|nr:MULTISPECIES: ABC transporter ATP-binding protein [Bacillota]QNM14181.1 ABC transporter ATP-binding protein [[Eubacterium] hominis]MCH4285598.1 ABC transporter ATP-binding protein [Amedibacillus hominis]RGB53194.1 ABC transporter ATP-binding protein [Absiella sp. AM10-20]RGB54084.1 ABC transporter ATP-binding protein [Absiella sp. AM22-9]RGB64354.1 ABC transporter ATP-binding protein [Absiella sp. AM09-45]
MKEIMQVKNISKEYGKKGVKTRVLNNVSLEIYEGDFIAIMGPSGAGKSTLLNLLSTIDKPTHGSILMEGVDITKIKNDKLSNIRKKHIGFIFQDYNLLDNMTLMDNIALPLSINGKNPKQIVEKVKQLADLFGIKEHLEKYPYQLSGGQKQRGAAARALISDPDIVFADEPTGALDSKSSKELLMSLKKINEQKNATILMVTHDAFSASYAKQVYLLKDGEISCKLNAGDSRKEFYDRILQLMASLGGE